MAVAMLCSSVVHPCSPLFQTTTSTGASPMILHEFLDDLASSAPCSSMNLSSSASNISMKASLAPPVRTVNLYCSPRLADGALLAASSTS